MCLQLWVFTNPDLLTDFYQQVFFEIPYYGFAVVAMCLFMTWYELWYIQIPFAERHVEAENKKEALKLKFVIIVSVIAGLLIV